MSYTYFFYFTNIMRCFLKKNKKKSFLLLAKIFPKKAYLPVRVKILETCSLQKALFCKLFKKKKDQKEKHFFHLGS